LNVEPIFKLHVIVETWDSTWCSERVMFVAPIQWRQFIVCEWMTHETIVVSLLSNVATNFTSLLTVNGDVVCAIVHHILCILVSLVGVGNGCGGGRPGCQTRE